MRISDWSSDVCSSDLDFPPAGQGQADLDRGRVGRAFGYHFGGGGGAVAPRLRLRHLVAQRAPAPGSAGLRRGAPLRPRGQDLERSGRAQDRSEEHTSELQSLMRISYAVFCLKKKKKQKTDTKQNTTKQLQ